MLSDAMGGQQSSVSVAAGCACGVTRTRTCGVQDSYSLVFNVVSAGNSILWHICGPGLATAYVLRYKWQ